MQTDGQLYNSLHKGEREYAMTPPPGGPDLRDLPVKTSSDKRHVMRGGFLSGMGKDEIILLGIIFLIVSDKNNMDLPLLLALVYVLIS